MTLSDATDHQTPHLHRSVHYEMKNSHDGCRHATATNHIYLNLHITYSFLLPPDKYDTGCSFYLEYRIWNICTIWYSDKLDGNTTIIYPISSDKEIFNFPFSSPLFQSKCLLAKFTGTHFVGGDTPFIEA